MTPSQSLLKLTARQQREIGNPLLAKTHVSEFVNKMTTTPMSNEELLEALEFARVAMSFPEVRTKGADEMDLCDEYFVGLKEKLDGAMGEYEL